jgi:hypothetical protein
VAFFQIECGKLAGSWSVAGYLARLVGLGAITGAAELVAEPVATPAP